MYPGLPPGRRVQSAPLRPESRAVLRPDQSFHDVMKRWKKHSSMKPMPLNDDDRGAYSRVLPTAGAAGSVWTAGAAPGLHNQGTAGATPCPATRLRKSHCPLTAQGQRAAPNDPDLAAVVNAWDRLPEAVRAGIVAMV